MKRTEDITAMVARDVRAEAKRAANRAFVARLTPEEREYRRVLARISYYQKFLRERESQDAAPCSQAGSKKHRVSYMSPEELQVNLSEYKAMEARMRPMIRAISHQRLTSRQGHRTTPVESSKKKERVAQWVQDLPVGDDIAQKNEDGTPE